MSNISGIGSITELVIAQVRSRPVLWDKKDEMYGNIQAMDYEWMKLSAFMKRDKEFLKKRWRRVRDVFRMEIKKLNPPENPTLPLLHYYTGVWPHFESMLFLKDSLTKRTPRLFFPEENDETIDHLLTKTVSGTLVNTPATAIINTAVFGTHVSTTTANDSVQEWVAEATEVAESPETAFEEVEEDEEEMDEKPVYVESVWSETEVSKETESRGVKRKAEEWSSNLDEDVNFAKSIVGYLRKLNPIRKLMVRNEIQSILLRELLCDKCRCKGQQKACQCD